MLRCQVQLEIGVRAINFVQKHFWRLRVTPLAYIKLVAARFCGERGACIAVHRTKKRAVVGRVNFE